MNFLNPSVRARFSNGDAKVRFFLKLPKLFFKIFELFSVSRQSFIRTLSFAGHPFFKWECKGSVYFLTSKLFRRKNRLFAF